jgi:hypothetical protein
MQLNPPPPKPHTRLPEPYPGAKPVLESRPRPFSELTGRRHVPILTNASYLPYLRFKKPQSPYLSRVLRDKLEQRQKQMDHIDRLEMDLRWAADEDAWDKLVDHRFGRIEQSWQTELLTAKKELWTRLNVQSKRAKETARRMLSIVDEEKRLYEEERKVRKMEKNRKRQERKEAERGSADGSKSPEPAVNYRPITTDGKIQSKSDSTTPI